MADKFPIEADRLSIIEFLNGPNHFVIPVFQRNYAWIPRNCEQLYKDLIKIKDEPNKFHFFGSVVYVSIGGVRQAKFQIIDGQQRITTITLLILAMYRLLKQGLVTSNDSELETDLHSYLFDASGKHRLLPNKKDQKAFEKLFDEPAEYDKSSNLTTNFNFFYERIQKAEITIDNLINAISRLVIIGIKLSDGGNPQLVFESLNSTGLALTESDKVRNYLFVDMSPEQQEEYYNKYWEQIELNTEGYLDEFIRDYLSVKLSKAPIENKVYFEFKKYANEQSLQANDLLPDLRKYSRFYKILLGNEEFDDPRVNDCIYRLNRLETAVTRPFFLEVFRIQADEIITEEELFQIFRCTENYIGRRCLIRDLHSNALNKIFLKLHKDIVGFDNTLENYFEKFKCVLLSKREGGRFPDDKEFSEAFSNRQVYKIAPKNKEYILERLANYYGTKEDQDIYSRLDTDDKSVRYTIEHIMPKTLSDTWIQELGKDYEKIRSKWLDRVANLTLTAYNSELSNGSFEEKCNHPNGGYRNSGIRMNRQIAQNSHWGQNELEKRDRELTKIALKIWELPQTNYKPPQEEFRIYTLEDADDLTGKRIRKFVYKGIEQSVTEWTQMFQSVLKQLHQENPAILYRLAQKGGKEKYSNYFSNNSDSPDGYMDIASDLHCKKGTNTSTKLSILRHLFKIFEIDLDKLELYIKDKNKDKKNR